MTDDDMDRWQALANAAPPGPWRLLTTEEADADTEIAENGCSIIAELGGIGRDGRPIWLIVAPLHGVYYPHEYGALIAASRDAMPRLIAAQRESRDALDRAARERDEARAEAIEARRLRASLATAEGIYEDALVILGAADGESLTEAAARVVRERDGAEGTVVGKLRSTLAVLRARALDEANVRSGELTRERDAARDESARLRDAIGARDAEAVQLAEEEAERAKRRHADIDRLRAIIDGRTDPPSAAEVVAHGGQWLVSFYGGRSEVHDCVTARREAVEERWLRAGGNSARPRWWPLDGDGRLCAWPVVTEDVSAHEWVTRVAVAVCARCGVVRSADRETPCRGSLPGVGLRERAAETPEEDVWADIEVARALDAADGSALPPLPTSSTLRTRR